MTTLVAYAVTIVVVGIALSSLWKVKISAYLSTVVHEVGHALGSLVTGGEVHHIVVNSDASGYTTSSRAISLQGKLGGILTTASGYVMPPFLGAVALLLLGLVSPMSALLAIGITGAVGLVFSRGLLSVFASLLITTPGGLLGYIHFWGKGDVNMLATVMVIAYSALFFLEGARSIVAVRNIANYRKQGVDVSGDSISDARALSIQVPFTTEMFWVRFFISGGFVCAAAGAVGLIAFIVQLFAS